MARTVVIALVAGLVGGGIIYAAMQYLERNPVQVDFQIPPVGATPVPTPTPPPTRTPAPLPPDTLLPTATPAPSPASQPRLVPRATVGPQSTAQQTAVNAFAECNGQYDGWQKEHRAWGASSAIAEGRQTVADIRALVERYCGGVFPDLTLVANQPTVEPTTFRPVATVLPTATQTPTPAPTPEPTTLPPTATVELPAERHAAAKRQMLQLINEERGKAGLEPVALGENLAAQRHAEASLENCFSSHWGLDGLKPYMRYSLAGGYQSNGENGSGLDYCIRASDGYRAKGAVEARVREAMQGWMSSPGHRRNILDPQHRSVNIGIALDRYNTVMYQHFEGDYVEYDQLPSIDDGVLSLSGRARNGVRFAQGRDLGVHIFYDRPPRELTRGQIAQTYCYDNGRRVAALREPLTGGYRWTTHEFTTTYDPCPDPYDVSTSVPAPRSPAEAHQAWQRAYDASNLRQPETITVPWVTANQWTASGTSFSVAANIRDILERHGDGVYSLMLWGKIDGTPILISHYSIFHGVTPPDTYRSLSR